MNAYASPVGDFSRQVEDWMDAASAELRQAVAYVDAVVVPEVRRESAGAIRLLAGHLDRFAGWLDPQQSQPGETQR